MIARVPLGHWTTATVLAALRWAGITAPAVMDGPIHGRRLTAYVAQSLVPTLRPGDLGGLDNPGRHPSGGAAGLPLHAG